MSDDKDITVKVVETHDGEKVVEEWSPEMLSMAARESNTDKDSKK